MKTIDILKTISYAYILLPLIIFILGWTKIYLLGVPLTIAIMFSFYRMVMDTNLQRHNLFKSRNDIFKFVCIVLLIALWVYFSGIGGYTWQNLDHKWRNEIFDILVEYRWPVIKGASSGSNGMSYYIGFWMVPALVGKIFGLKTGYFAQYIWALIGVLLVYILICRRIKKIAIWPLILFVFFSGLDIVGLFIRNHDLFLEYSLGTHIETWAIGYQFSSFTTQLFWVFNQAIYGWIVTLLVIDERSSNMVLVMAAGLFSAPLPAVGIFPMALCKIWNNSVVDNPNGIVDIVKKAFISLITYQNVVGIIVTAVVGSMFLSNNAINYTASTSGQYNELILICLIVVVVLLCVMMKHLKNKRVTNMYHDRTHQVKRLKKASKIIVGLMVFAFIIYGASHTIPAKNDITKDNNLLFYILFLLVEVGVYIALTYRIGKKDNIYISSIIMFMVCPIFVIGSSIDFCMRACIPAQLILYIYIVILIKDLAVTKNRLIIAILSISLLFGSVTTISEFARTINNHTEYKENGIAKARNEEIMESMNFCSKVDDSIFYKYLAQY